MDCEEHEAKGSDNCPFKLFSVKKQKQKQQPKTPVARIFGWKEVVWRPPLPSGQPEAHASPCLRNSLEEPLCHFIFALENTVA